MPVAEWSLDWLVEPEPWMRDALCAQTDPDAFFPEKGERNDDAMRVCAACDVRARCLEFALRTRQGDGIWGGTVPYTRRRMVRERGESWWLL